MLLDIKPYFALSCIVHVILLAFLFYGSSGVTNVRKSQVGPVLIDLIAVGEVTNVSVEAKVGKKSYSQDVNVVKRREVKKTPKNKGVVAPSSIKKDVKRVKKKPMESQSIKETSRREGFETAFKSLNSDPKETVKLNVDEVERSGVLGIGSATSASKAQVISVADSIRSQIVNCWSVPYGALNLNDAIITVSIELDSLGGVTDVEVMDRSRYDKDPFFRAVADSAVRAIYKCSPLQGLPVDIHSVWRSIELSFDPSSMVA